MSGSDDRVGDVDAMMEAASSEDLRLAHTIYYHE